MASGMAKAGVVSWWPHKSKFHAHAHDGRRLSAKVHMARGGRPSPSHEAMPVHMSSYLDRGRPRRGARTKEEANLPG